MLSIGLLNELFKEKWSEGLAGGILESFGRLFKITDSRFYVYPWGNRKGGELVTAENFQTPENLQYLYRHFRENGMIHAFRVETRNCSSILTRYSENDCRR